jgi:hypothetical protein
VIHEIPFVLAPTISNKHVTEPKAKVSYYP